MKEPEEEVAALGVADRAEKLEMERKDFRLELGLGEWSDRSMKKDLESGEAWKGSATWDLVDSEPPLLTEGRRESPVVQIHESAARAFVPREERVGFTF